MKSIEAENEEDYFWMWTKFEYRTVRQWMLVGFQSYIRAVW
jgi:hypothetical protein